MRKLLSSSIFLLIAIICLFFPKQTFASESIKNFDIKLTASKNGNLEISEKINYDFADNSRHGIYRQIPLVSQVGNLYRVISINLSQVLLDNTPEKYSVSRTGDQIQIKIGDPNLTLTGDHSYEIDYTVSNAIGSNYPDHDEIYWNATGNSWNVPISLATISISTDFGQKPTSTICFTGTTGSTNRNCSVSLSSNIANVTATDLTSGEGLTIVSSFPVNTFPKSILQKNSPSQIDSANIIKTIIVTYAFLNLILAPLLLFLYFKFKHKSRFGPPSVNFDIPEYPKGTRITPAQAGTIDNAKLDKDDLSATLFDLAIRKYIRIEQIKQKAVFLGLGKKEDFNLIKLKSFNDLNNFEKKFTSSVFADKKSIAVSEISLEYSDFSDLQIENFQSLISRGFFKVNPTGQMSALLGVGIVLCLTLNIFLGGVLIFLSRKLNGRTQLGDKIDWQIDGLKLFLKSQATEYKFFTENALAAEAMIPYAIALGYIDEYMKRLKILYPKYQPDWYTGSAVFYAIYPHFNSSLSNNITTSAPTSSSGFSGGFSGGGGGGGGGGSW